MTCRLKATTLKLRATMWLLVILSVQQLTAQDFNRDHNLTFVNHATPKSPESASFEKYGTIPVSEKTGIPQISIPLHNLSSSTLSTSISLSYHASGIKVSQEATWVGLGWDIMTGGRITLDIRGGYDGYTKQYLQAHGLKETLQFLYLGYGNAVNDNVVVNSSNPCLWNSTTITDYMINGILPCIYPGVIADIDSIYHDGAFWDNLENISRHGAAQPDLYHVEFMGNSFTFYYDLLTDSIRIQGEQNRYRIHEYTEPYRYFVVVDNYGVGYAFKEIEQSQYDPPLGLYTNITTAWLLSGIYHNNGDSIIFNYANYGAVFPAPVISESENHVLMSSGNNSNVPIGYNLSSNKNGGTSHQKVYQYPKYITEILTSNERAAFALSTRKDLTGDGARKLDSITITHRLSNEILRKVKFNYDYFESPTAQNYYFDTSLACFRIGTPGPDNNAKNHLTLRLKLNAIDMYGTDAQTAYTHQFGYHYVQLPNKVSLAQDHWGYYNMTNDAPTSSMISFTPSVAALISEGVYAGSLTPSPHLPGHANRKADVYFARACVLESITYPTGGITQFEYELHKFYTQFTSVPIYGAGLRIKKITTREDYSSDWIEKTYEYGETGFYQGRINYIQAKMKRARSADEHGNVNSTESVSDITLFSNGILSTGGPLVMYANVVEKISAGEYGRIERVFDVHSPSEIHVKQDFGATRVFEPYYIAPQPSIYSYGNLVREKYFDADSNLLKETEHFYNPNVTNTLYNVRLDDILILHPLETMALWTRNFVMYFEPVIYRNTVPDSSVTKEFANSEVFMTRTKHRYNAYFQNEFTTTWNSRGEKTMVQTKTPLSYEDLPVGDTELTGNARAISWMRMNNVLESPIEKIILSQEPGQDTVVLGGAYYIYDPLGNTIETYLLENGPPVPIAQFDRSYYGGISAGYNLSKDSRYVLDHSMTYGGPVIEWADFARAGPYLQQVSNRATDVSYIYDTLNNVVLAVAEGTSYADIAYSSFEIVHPGSWAYTGSTTTDNTSPSGKQCYDLSQMGGALSKSGLNTSTHYYVSYWTKNAVPYSITGTAGTAYKGVTINGWTYFQHRVTGQSAITLTGTGYIDEVRVYPAKARMKTIVYDAAKRPVTELMHHNNIMHYEYDPTGRLAVVRDFQQMIVKKFAYKLAKQTVNFDGEYYISNAQSQSWTKNNCSSGVPQTIVYSVPEGRYKSLVSQQDADQQAINDLNANGQAYANANGGCQFFNQPQSAIFTQNNCPPGYMGITVTYAIPANQYMSLVSQINANQMALDELAVISVNGQAEANAGTCTEMVAIHCTSSVPEPFTLELYNVSTHQFYYFLIEDYGEIGQVPSGVYDVRINPQNYTQPYSYIINDTYYQSGEMVAVFENISFTDSYNSTIYIY